jgi:hypothetical protein
MEIIELLRTLAERVQAHCDDILSFSRTIFVTPQSFSRLVLAFTPSLDEHD